MLQAEHVTVRYGEKTAAEDVSFRLEEGMWLMLAGPNGAGKTTLLKAAAGAVPYAGRILWEGKDLRTLKTRVAARNIGVLSQQHGAAYAFTAEEAVELGRYAHRKGLLGGDPEGQARVEAALEMTGLTALRRKPLTTLSGGEMQRVFLAQVFAQDPRALLLDEPANHLDLRYQEQIFGLIREWVQAPGRAVISVVHDLTLARKYGTHALLMSEGRCTAQGEIREAMTEENLRQAYGMDVYGWMREALALWT